MNRLERLREIADRQLGGLQANGKLLGEIKRKAAGRDGREVRLRAVWAFCVVAVLLAGAVLGVLSDSGAVFQKPSPSMLDTQPAGSAEEAAAHSDGLKALLDIPPGGVTIGSVQDVPAYQSIFAEGQGGNFPMILLYNEAYRMLKTPAQLSASLLSESLGAVTEYTLEPALSSGGVVSNIVGQGIEVYAVQGMRGAMVAAQVNGENRVFQRVSFAGSAVIGNESLADTLCETGDVLSMELSGVGAIDDAEAARRLMGVLLEYADYQSASVSQGGSQSLLIGLKNGLSLQLTVTGDSVSACGTWSCPEFFEAFLVTLEN